MTRGRQLQQVNEAIRRTQELEKRAQTNRDADLVVPVEGDSACRCLDVSELEPLHRNTHLNVLEIVDPHDDVNLTDYGVGCHRHDANLGVCRCNSNDDDSCDDNNVPSWCHQRWCWVQPFDCNLLSHRAALWVKKDVHDPRAITATNERYYSYATCRSFDTKTPQLMSDSLYGKTLNIGMFHYGSGFLGSYQREGKPYVGSIEDDWSGPIVDFVREAARRGGFRLNVEAPPAFLRNKSREFFGPSIPDLCVYATTLGYLDACPGFLLTNERRVSVTDWMILGHEPILLISVLDNVGDENVSSHIRTLFTPFTTWTWTFVVWFFLPLMATIFVVHEYGQPGSVFPDRELAFCEEEDGRLLERRVPFFNHVPRAIYSAALGMMQMVYDQTVTTPGAKLHLIGFMFFELTLVAVYTANLTVILSDKHANVAVADIHQVIENRWRICAIRKVYEAVSKLYDIPADKFVVDPTDGKPGIDTFPLTRRLMDAIDPIKAETDDRYCHIGLGYEENVLGLHAEGLHCDKTLVGKPVATFQYGFPLFETVSPVLKTIMYQMKNDGWWQRLYRDAIPVDTCPPIQVSHLGGEATFGFGFVELSGIWLVSGGFAVVGLLVTGWMVWRARLRHGSKYKSAVRYDQHGQRIKRQQRDSISIAATASFKPTKKRQRQEDFELEDIVLAFSGNGTGVTRETALSSSFHTTTSSKYAASLDPPSDYKTPNPFLPYCSQRSIDGLRRRPDAMIEASKTTPVFAFDSHQSTVRSPCRKPESDGPKKKSKKKSSKKSHRSKKKPASKSSR